MSGKERDKIEARLRKKQDADLRKATAGISAGELSEMVRDGLRLMLGIKTKKSIQMIEQPVLQQFSSTPRRIIGNGFVKDQNGGGI